MKLHSFIYEILIFSLILLFCIVPPFFAAFTEEQVVFAQVTFPWKSLCLFLFALVFYYLILQKRFTVSFYTLLTFIFCLSLLFFNFLVIKAASILLADKINANPLYSGASVVVPQNAVQWIFNVFNFLFASFYEEVIYRVYFPEQLVALLKRINKNRIFQIAAEIVAELIALAVFSFAHLYLGFLSVINAALAHIVLRFFYRLRKDFISCWAAHFIYNIISLILL